jgi:hypothetical protein
MNSAKDPRELAAPVNTAAGEAAFQVLEMLLLALIERGVIAPETLVAEIESLAAATPETGMRPPASTLKGQLGVLANSLSAYRASGE